jgi:hypothetical protein
VILALGARQVVFPAVGARNLYFQQLMRQLVILAVAAPIGIFSSWHAPTGIFSSWCWQSGISSSWRAATGNSNN